MATENVTFALKKHVILKTNKVNDFKILDTTDRRVKLKNVV